MMDPKMGVGEPGAFERMNARDKEWMDALITEFNIGGAMLEPDRKWVHEKKSLPERWARLVRLAITPKDVKLHDYKEAPPIDVTAPKQPKRDLAEVMKQLRPVLEKGGYDMAGFNDIEHSVGFSPPENERLHWARLCEMLEEDLPKPDYNSPQWVRDVADIITGRK